MLAEERRQEILRVLNNKGSVHVTEISKLLEVTEETIRRDLDILDEKKLLKRTHGGAITIEDNKSELSFNVRKEKNIEEKDIIAEKAVELINNGDTIFLDASTTSMYLASQLKDFTDLTIVTNSVRIILELAENTNINIIATGGILRPNSLSYVGPLTNAAIKKYYADKFFTSCKGISAMHGATDSNEMEIEIKKLMSNQAQRLIVLADYSKFNQVGLAQFATFEDIDTIITDDNIDESIKKEFESKGKKII
ncbi:DeoR/GlpR family DNA-binding transcription regulator [Natronospora cellulosivora (SeqCode)]